jgi:hypothetical protein
MAERDRLIYLKLKNIDSDKAFIINHEIVKNETSRLITNHWNIFLYAFDGSLLSVPSARQEQPGSVLPPQPQPLSTQVGERLRSSFEVADIDGESIRVRKSSAQSAVPSLFEEAIILGKLRAFLKSSTASENQSVSFHNGTATVSLSPKINSGTASVLIAKMLSLDGVNEVRAGFSD